MNTRSLNSSEYTFDPGAGTLTFTSAPDRVILVVNNTRENQILYNFACEEFTGILSGTTLTFTEVDVSGQNASDDLTVVIEERITIGQDPSADSFPVVISTEQEGILSSRASETTLSGIKTQTDKLTFDVDRLKVDAELTASGVSQQFIKDTVLTDVEIDTATPVNNEPLPTALYNSLGLQGTATNPVNIAIRDSATGSRAIVDQNGAVKLGEAIILAGDVLYGQPLSDFLWQDLSINSGSTFGAAGEQRLETGVVADGEVILQSKKKSRFMISQFNISHFGIQLEPAGNLSDPNTITEWGNVTFLNDAGAVNATANGVFFRVQGDPVTPVWSIVSIKNGVETSTPLASWNGAQKDNFNTSPDLSVYEIQYNAGTAIFFQGSNFIHRLAGLTSTYAATYNFPVALRIRNINGNTTNRSFGSRAAGAYRLGEERGELISRALTVSTLLKTGAGYVGTAYLSRTGGGGGNSGIAIIYDGVDATGIAIGRIDVSTDDVKGVTLNGTFSNGLYVDIIGPGTNTLTINFE